jgi:hypothetical protein
MTTDGPDSDSCARDWQLALARRLAELPFATLCDLPESSELDPPPELAGRRFAVERRGPRNDRLFVDVIELTATRLRPRSVDEVVRAIQSRQAVGFEKHADGTVRWPRPA